MDILIVEKPKLLTAEQMEEAKKLVKRVHQTISPSRLEYIVMHMTENMYRELVDATSSSPEDRLYSILRELNSVYPMITINKKAVDMVIHTIALKLYSTYDEIDLIETVNTLLRSGTRLILVKTIMYRIDTNTEITRIDYKDP